MIDLIISGDDNTKNEAYLGDTDENGSVDVLDVVIMIELIIYS